MIISVDKKEGDFIEYTERICLISDTEGLIIKGWVPENDILKVKKGQLTRVLLKARNGEMIKEKLDGKVVKIAPFVSQMKGIGEWKSK